MTNATNIGREQALFSLCLEHPASDWPRILAENCNETAVRERVLRLLEHHSETGSTVSSFLKLDGSDPERIGPYRILQRLGEGGMGIVYAAEQREPVRRRVAVKVLRGASREVLARFDVERQALSLMTHPNIAYIVDAGTSPDHNPYIVMEFVPGETITRYCRRNGLSIESRLALFRDVCDAVQHAHQKGVIHRDIKPSNILVMEDSDRAIAKVIDFGIAKAIAQPLTQHTLETRIGTLLGTPAYMSPEQVELSPLDVDTRADVYALGAVLYELLCDVPPFDFRIGTDGYTEIQRTVRETEPQPPSARTEGVVARTLRGELDWIVLRALQKERNRRYGSAAELSEDVRRWLDLEPTLAGPPSRLRHVAKFVRRNRATVALATIAFLALAGLAGSMALQSRWLMEERDRANREARIANETTAFLVDLFRAGDPHSGGQRALDTDTLLGTAEVRIEATMPSPSGARAHLYRALGRIHLNLGHYAEGERILQRSLDDTRQLFGEDHLETLQSRREHIVAQVYLGRWQEAVTEIEDVVARRRALLGEDDVENFRLMANLGSTLFRMGETQEALPILESAAEGFRKLLGPTHVNVLGIENNLALLDRAIGNIAESRAKLENVVSISRDTLGELHPQTVGALFNLASAYGEDGMTGKASAIYEQVLATQLRELGAEHPDTLMTRFNRVQYLPMPTERITEMRDVLAIRERVLGGSHPTVQETRIELAMLLADAGGSLEERAGLLEMALSTLKSRVDPGNRSNLLGERLLAAVRAEQGRIDEAIHLLIANREHGATRKDLEDYPTLAPLLDSAGFEPVSAVKAGISE